MADPRATVVKFLADRVGLPYLWGGKDPSVGLDCSGAVTNAYVAAGLMKPNAPKRYGSRDLREALRPISEAEAKPGDTVFYGPGGKVNHVMLYVGDGSVIGATGGGSKTTSVDIAMRDGAYVRKEPLRYRKDLIGFGSAPIVETPGVEPTPAPLLTPGTPGTSDHNVPVVTGFYVAGMAVGMGIVGGITGWLIRRRLTKGK